MESTACAKNDFCAAAAHIHPRLRARAVGPKENGLKKNGLKKNGLKENGLKENGPKKNGSTCRREVGLMPGAHAGELARATAKFAAVPV
ncbi:MAG: hypothetical protein IT473_05015 [Lysobacter sp.]|nr:hypothetical protein [Lysobacter sp.]